MQQIQVQGFITAELEPRLVIGFVDMSTGHTITLAIEEAEGLASAINRSIADAWDLVKAEAAGEGSEDSSPPILPPNADEGPCCRGLCQLSPHDLDSLIQTAAPEVANGNVQEATPPPITDEEAAERAARLSDLVRNDGFNSEDARSC